MTPLDPPQRWAKPYADKTIDEMRINWANMREFHLTTQQWPPLEFPKAHRTDDQSPLERTMVHTSPTDGRLMTYAWQRLPATMPWPESSGHDTGIGLSNAMWNQWQDPHRPKLSVRVGPSRSPRRRQTTPAQPRQKFSQVTRQMVTADLDTQTRWESMREFHSSVPQWPSMAWPNSTPMEGGSPLVWSLLYSPCLTG